MQVSNDLNSWQDVTDVINNGFYMDENAPAPDKTYVNTIKLDETVSARYVRMQGVQRRREVNNNNNTGFSLYEFEVYGPGWSDENYVEEYLKTLSVPERVSRNFTLPVKDDTYGVHVSWTSDNEAVTVDENGKATIKRTEEDVKVTLKATVSRGDVTQSAEYTVVVASKNGKEIEFSPVPQDVLYEDGVLELGEELNLVFEEEVSDTVKENYEDVLEEAGISYNVADAVSEDMNNLLVGVKGQDGVVDAYFADKEYDKEESTDKAEGYVLDVNADEQVIAVLGADEMGAKYGSYTLEDILEQSEGMVREMLVEDAPDTQFRGFIEGFYGAWSHENRKSLMEFGGRYKMNTYIYGPKNDEYHYGKWRELYPDDKLAELKELVDIGKKSGVEFVWAAHPGGHTDLSDKDIADLEAKFDQLYSIGVRQFAIFFDDSSTNNTRLVEYMNKIQKEYVETKGDVKPLIFCPQYYNKKNGNEAYLKNLRNFDEDIQIMWTGDFVVSEINQSVIDYIVNLIQRPVFIWWNWPVNDLGRAGMMHLGPSEAVENNIKNMSGLTSNPMNQAQASKVALYSIADYTWNTGAYDSQESWMRAIAHIITDDEEASKAFQIFAQNCAAAPMSFASTDESVYMQPDIAKFWDKYLNGEDASKEIETLKAEFQEIRDSITVLKGYKGTNNLSGEIDPWMNTMDKIAKAAYYVLDNLDEFEKLDAADDDTVEMAMNILAEGRDLLNQSNGSKKAAQKVLYPFVNELLNAMEAKYYEAVGMTYPAIGYGSSNTDYTKAMDGTESTWVTLGKYVTDNYFGMNLGNVVPVKNVDIVMGANEKEYYKKGVLEYSVDNKNWTEIGEFDTPQIHVTLDNVNARFIRYRATENWEDEVTGGNVSNALLYEMSANEGVDYHTYTDQKDLKDLAEIEKSDNILTVKADDNAALTPGKSFGVEFDVLKNLQLVSKEAAAENLKLEVSMDGKTWEEHKWNTLENFEAKYIKVTNEGNENLALNDLGLVIQLAGKANLSAKASDSISGDVYSGNAGNLVDGDEGTTFWLKRGKGDTERYIELELTDVIPLYDMEVFYAKDWANGGRVDLSKDGKEWETVTEFSSAAAQQKLDLKGTPAKYIRYYINNGEWCNMAEIYVNRTLDEDVFTITGDGTDLNYLLDGRAFTSPSLEKEGGSVTYSLVNEPETKELHVLKNKGTSANLEVKVNGEWKDAGVLDNMCENVDLSKYGKVTDVKLSWEKDSNLVIYELWTKEGEDVETEISTAVLEYALELAGKADTKDVIDSVVKRFEDAKTNGQSLLDRVNAGDTSVTQAQVDAAWRELIEVMQYLSFKQGDKADLEKVIALAETMEEKLDSYVEEGKQAFVDALNAARTVAGDGDAMQDEVDASWKALLEAMANLRLKANKDALEGLVNGVENMNLDAYTKESAEVFKVALANAKSVLADEALSEDDQAKVDAAAKQLASAKDGLKAKQASTGDVNTDNKTDKGNSGATDNNKNSADTKTTTKSAKTGDTAQAATWMFLLAAAGSACVIMKKKKNTER